MALWNTKTCYTDNSYWRTRKRSEDLVWADQPNITEVEGTDMNLSPLHWFLLFVSRYKSMYKAYIKSVMEFEIYSVDLMSLHLYEDLP